MFERVALTVACVAFLGACVGLVLRRDRSLFPICVQFSLRTLLILLAVGPPLLATAWTHREALLAIQRPAEVYIPRHASATTAANLRIRAAQRQLLHYYAGACAVVFYPVAVILLASVLRTMRHWRRPPKKTPITWAALGASTLAACFVLLFYLTFPPPWGYTRWTEYFAAQRQEQSQDIGRR
jgi:hypothetical protein